MLENSGFNLIERPWIPLLDRKGNQSMCSLTSLAEYAGNSVRIGGELPTQSFAILRLYLAIVHRALADPRTGHAGPADLEEWLSLRKNWPRVGDAVQAYLERFRESFDLFHPVKPFFQVADLHTASGAVGPVSAIIADLPAGRQFLTLRTGSGTASISREEAARWLLHAHAYDIAGIHSGAVGDPRVKAGKGYGIGTGWCGKLGGIHLVGSTLQETVLLNLIPFAEVGIETRPDDLPPWERLALGPGPEAPDRQPKGPIELYTWQSRRIKLFEKGERVIGALVCQGDPVDEANRVFLEPMTAWRLSKAQSTKRKADVYMPRALDPERTLWRGLEALLPVASACRGSSGAADFIAPRLVEWASVLELYGNEGGSGGLCRLRAVGIRYGVQQAVIDELVNDEVDLPWVVFGERAGEFTDLVLDVLDSTEAAVVGYGRLIADLTIAAGGDPQNVSSARSSASALLYSNLDVQFRRWLAGLSCAAEIDLLREEWRTIARHTTLELASADLENCGPAAWVGREVLGRQVDAGLAERWFRRRLSNALPHDKEDPSHG